MLEAQLAAEELVLLPHVLFQVPEEAEGWQVGAPRAFMLQQLPGETPEPPTMLGSKCCCPEQSRMPAKPHPGRQ